MFRKFASIEILEVKSAAQRVVDASLDKFANFEDYKTDDGFMYVRVRAISSRVNKNHDGWPSEELKKSYRTFIGKPIFIDHHNSDPKRARGVVVDAAIHIEDDEKHLSALDSYYASAPKEHLPPTWIELLLEVDAKSFPKLAKAIVDGDIDGVSMGCNVELSICSHCANRARSPQEYCKHITSKGAYFDYKLPDGTKISKRSYEDCYDIGFFELSFVFDPADETAGVRGDIIKAAKLERIAAVKAEAGIVKTANPINRGWNQQQGNPSQQAHPAMDNLVQQFGPGQQPQADISAPGQGGVQEMPFHPGVQDSNFQQMPFNPNDPNQQLNPQEMPFQPNQNDDLWENLASREAGLGDAWDKLRGRESVIPCPYCGDPVTKTSTEFRPGPMNTMFTPEGQAHQCWVDNPSVLLTETEKRQQGLASVRTAEQNDPPQAEMTTAPDKVDTLRQEQVCPICGSDMEDGVCEVCNYEEPPEGFDNPDLQKAKEVDQQMRQQDADQAQQQQNPGQDPNATPVAPDQGQPPPTPGGPPLTTSSITTNPITTTTLSSEHKVSAAPKGTRINTQERPLLPAARQPTDEPKNVRTIQDSKGPVRSSVNPKEKMTQTQKTADGATPQGDGVQADKRVDVVGVGGTSGDPLAGITNENVEKDTGDFTAPHTDTWSGNEGDSLGQQDPVTTEVFRGAGDGNQSGNAVGVTSPPGVNSSVHTADGSGDLGGPFGENLSGGESAEQGVSADSPSGNGFPDHDPTRVDLLAGLTEEVGGPTSTFGSDDFHIVEPTQSGQNANELGGPIGVAVASAKVQMLKAIKVAEAEVDLGLIDPEAKFDRVAELEDIPETALDATLETLSKVRTAGLKKATASTQKTAGNVGRMPSFKPVTSGIDIEAGTVSEDAFADSLY